MRAKLKELKVELIRRRHQPLPAQGRSLGQVVGGFSAITPTNQLPGLVGLLAPRQESVAARAPAAQPEGSLDVRADGPAGCRLPVQTADPTPMAEHPFCRHTPEVGAVCLNWACTVLCGGALGDERPYRDPVELRHCSELLLRANWRHSRHVRYGEGADWSTAHTSSPNPHDCYG